MPSLVVLVVEDDPIVRMNAVILMEDAGIEVVETTNADDAIAILESRTDVRVVFTDIEMPGSMNGLKLAFAVRDRWPSVTIIIASGRTQPPPDEMPPEATFLRKPYSDASVLEAVRNAA
jgi:CheY-like chemotaxis protein